MTFVRFAPSPTGRIHIGNARTAILNWLFARKTRRPVRAALRRYRYRALEGRIRRRRSPHDLDWLGIKPDRVEYQSKRVRPLIDAAADRLKRSGRLYPCYETADELERRRKRQLARHQPPVYDRAALELTPRTERRARSGRTQAALALQARPSRRRMERSHPRAAAYRHGVAFRSGAGARGRHLSLHAAVGRRRHRLRASRM